jgi:arylformamidase
MRARRLRLWMAVAVVVLGIALLTSLPAADARGRFRERVAERLAQRRAAPATPAALPANVRAWRDQPYGSDPRQRYDVYSPQGAAPAPVLFIVHGGAWRSGDKGAANLVEAKIAHWSALGYVVISTNYRMLPDADPLTQAREVASAIASAQRDSARWGGDPDRFVMMGHSAGAHLSALITASPTLLAQAKARPVRGAVLLDSAMLDTERFMAKQHARLYDDAFGSDPDYWRATSPKVQLSAPGVPLLAVCSSRRKESCAQAQAFVAHAKRIGRRAQVLEQDLSHGEINAQLGLASAYTDAVDQFLENL